MSPEWNNDTARESARECLAGFDAAVRKWRQAVTKLDRIAERFDQLVVKLQAQKHIEEKCTQRLARLREKAGYLEAPSQRLTRRFTREKKQAEADIQNSITNMRAYIVTFSVDIKHAEENLEFFDRLATHPVRNSGPMIAVVEKLIGPISSPEDMAPQATREKSNQLRYGSASVPIPRGLGARLDAAMKLRGHTQADACSVMNGMHPKTLRKLLAEEGMVHLASVNQAKTYIKDSR